MRRVGTVFAALSVLAVAVLAAGTLTRCGTQRG